MQCIALFREFNQFADVTTKCRQLGKSVFMNIHEGVRRVYRPTVLLTLSIERFSLRQLRVAKIRIIKKKLLIRFVRKNEFRDLKLSFKNKTNCLNMQCPQALKL